VPPCVVSRQIARQQPGETESRFYGKALKTRRKHLKNIYLARRQVNSTGLFTRGGGTANRARRAIRPFRGRLTSGSGLDAAP
jgi:hypothetical protein